MKMNFIAFCWSAFFLLGVCCVAQQQPPEIARTDAEEHLVKRIDPEYPPIAKAARLQGKVLLKATISKETWTETWDRNLGTDGQKPGNLETWGQTGRTPVFLMLRHRSKSQLTGVGDRLLWPSSLAWRERTRR